jgi:hypothetical protein
VGSGSSFEVLSPQQHPLFSSVQSEEPVTLNSLDTSSPHELDDSAQKQQQHNHHLQQSKSPEKKHHVHAQKRTHKGKKKHPSSASSSAAKLKLDVQDTQKLSPRSRRRRDRRLKRSHTRHHE